MEHVELDILPQPTETSCGPTCLHALYKYYDDELPLQQVIDEVAQLEGGGTYAVHLATHAARRNYDVRIYTYNLQVFDPTWFNRPGVDLAAKLRARRDFIESKSLRGAIEAYLEFLEYGGELRWESLTPNLIRKYLKRGAPIITGLSATYLYQSAREWGPHCEYDDVRGNPSGHFVVLAGYEPETRSVVLADPFRTNPLADAAHYAVDIDRLISAILLGVLTYDANMMVIRPRRPRALTNEWTTPRARAFKR